ncbi:MAG: 1-(5-phosphoribosyl)-5-[(5-phosphoribosylamino)methylideneamino]imidazole-4-carboxamide isomerase [Thermoflavifilum sp.]|nr:1-(5-phosphoribosyl)-5-[(5-phosphoribosylamino)methylideneamino]imidazole-4-carboxamide isomerase [Thermoflavifilum sp.]
MNNSFVFDIIPAIDLIDGHCVRLHQGNYEQQTRYDADPLSIAQAFEDAGIRRLHLVDLDGARLRKVQNWAVLERIAQHTRLIIDFGGGITQASDIRRALDSGASLITVGSIAVKQPSLFQQWLEQFGPEKFLLGADVKNDYIAIHGWQETSSVSIIDFLHVQLQMGVRQVFCTDISRDGTLRGPAFDLYETLLQAFPSIHLIASGGVRDMHDITQLSRLGLRGVIIGKALFEGRIQLSEIQAWMANATKTASTGHSSTEFQP